MTATGKYLNATGTIVKEETETRIAIDTSRYPLSCQIIIVVRLFELKIRFSFICPKSLCFSQWHILLFEFTET
jgi:hypothetical protein